MKKPDLSQASIEELLSEVYRRRTVAKKTLNEVEVGLLQARTEDITRGFSQWLQEATERETNDGKPCPRCGQRVSVNAKKRERVLYTAVGKVSYRRNYHYCQACKHGFYPLDQDVGAPEEGQATRELARRAIDFAVNESYELGCERFEFHYGFSISTCLLQSLIERIPLPEYAMQEPIVPSERITVGADGSMLPMRKGWQECKLATVVRDKHHSPKTAEKRGSISEAIYIATMGDVHAFEAHLKPILPPRVGIKDRGKTPAPEVVWLWDGQVQTVLDELEEALSFACKRDHKKALRKLIGYYTENKTRMDYKTYREKGHMIGSGITESAHKHVLPSRMKKSGQHWSEHGAEKMVRLRALYQTHGPHRFLDVVSPENDNALDFIDKLAA